MKSVLMSIQPKWCELIASGKKTVEVRKTRPKIDVPFKCYIYQTKKPVSVSFSGTGQHISEYDKTCYYNKRSGKVIGEFVCDRIEYVRNYGDMVDSYDCIASCLSANEIIEYAKDKNGNFVYTYGWHISDLVIYDKPKELSEFHKVGYTETKESFSWLTREEEKSWQIKRPPQSWCYVEGVAGE